jgi:peptide/nickel transport system substrate-binding protein
MIHSLHKSLRVLSTSAAFGLLLAAAPQAFAATPADTLVEGFAFDDIITIDPGEAFELSTAEQQAGDARPSRYVEGDRRRGRKLDHV